MAFTTKAQNGWLRSDAELETGIRHARLAIKCSGEDAVALADGGLALAHLARDVETGADCVRRALGLNANSATVWHRSSWVNIYLGKPETALEHIAIARRLSPLDIQMLQMMQSTAAASFHAGKFEDAALWASRALQLRPHFREAF